MRSSFFIFMTAGLIPVTCAVHATASISDHYVMNSDQQMLLSDRNIRATGYVHIVSRDMIVDSNEATYHREDLAELYLVACGDPLR